MRCALLLVLSGVLAAAENAPEDEVTFRTSTQLVVVNVTARDRSGKLLEDLRAEDFAVYEDGSPQRIVAFEYQNLHAAPVSREVAGSGARGAAGPGEVRYKDRRLLVVFFDALSLAPAELWRARDAALKFVREDMSAADLVAVYRYSGEVRVLQDFTDDRDQLTRVIGGLAVQANGRASDDSEEVNLFHTDRKLSALTQVLKTPGSLRKALVYFYGSAGGGGGNEWYLPISSVVVGGRLRRLAVGGCWFGMGSGLCLMLRGCFAGVCRCRFIWRLIRRRVRLPFRCELGFIGGMPGCLSRMRFRFGMGCGRGLFR